jgi:hypothetical protein
LSTARVVATENNQVVPTFVGKFRRHCFSVPSLG